MNNIQIAIDGPAGSGKSTISKLLAKRLNFIHIDTGAMYRAITYKALELKIDLENESEYSFLDSIELDYKNDAVTLDGINVNEFIRSKEVTDNVSVVAKHRFVRDSLVKIQQLISKRNNIVMDGRDIGTVVLPNATVKVFLDASVQVRAKRRFIESPNGMTLNELTKDIERRDLYDSTRDYNPLIKAKDAISIDTSDLSIEEVVEEIIFLVKKETNVMEQNDFMEKYLTDIVELKVGREVDGTVLVVADNYLILDLHSNIEGKIYLDEFTNDKTKKFSDFVKVGDVIKARVNKIIDGDNNLAYLSRKHILEQEDFNYLVECFEKGENIKAVVVKSVLKGAILKYKDVELFMHESQFGELSFEELKGKSIEVEVQSVDKDEKKVRVSRSQVEYKQRRKENNEKYETDKALREEYSSNLNVDDIVKAKVVETKEKFAIVEVGPCRAILPISQLDHKRYENTSDLLKVGDLLEVKVIENAVVDGRRKIAVSRKALIVREYDKFIEAHPIGTIVDAVVDKKMPFGVVCTLADDVTGLLHFSEFSYNPKDRDYSSLTHGAKIQVKIISHEESSRKIGLSIKQLTENPWNSVNITIGDIVEATVVEIPKGRSVVLTLQGVNALMPISEVADVPRVNKVEDHIKVGDTVKCKVLNFDRDSWYIRLSIKALTENTENTENTEKEEFVDNYDSGDDTTVTLGDIINK